MNKIKGINYSLLSDFEKQKLLDEILERKTELNNEIDIAISQTDKPNLKKIYRQIRDMPDISINEIDNKEWLWNCGNLRSPCEIYIRNKQIENEDYYKYEWIHDKNKPKILIFMPQLLWLGMFAGSFNKDCGVLAFLTFPLSFLISLIINYFINSNIERKASKHNVPYTDEDYKNAIFEKRASSAAIKGGIISIGISSYKGYQEIKNPDSWPEM